MWVVKYTWDYDRECQFWYEQRFELLYEAKEFAASLSDDGVAITQIFKIQ